jgi:hypothetical protein
MINSLLKKIYVFILFALFSLILRILIICLGEETSRKLKYRDEILWEKYEKGN